MSTEEKDASGKDGTESERTSVTQQSFRGFYFKFYTLILLLCRYYQEVDNCSSL